MVHRNASSSIPKRPSTKVVSKIIVAQSDKPRQRVEARTLWSIRSIQIDKQAQQLNFVPANDQLKKAAEWLTNGYYQHQLRRISVSLSRRFVF